MTIVWGEPDPDPAPVRVVETLLPEGLWEALERVVATARLRAYRLAVALAGVAAIGLAVTGQLALNDHARLSAFLYVPGAAVATWFLIRRCVMRRALDSVGIDLHRIVVPALVENVAPSELSLLLTRGAVMVPAYATVVIVDRRGDEVALVASTYDMDQTVPPIVPQPWGG